MSYTWRVQGVSACWSPLLCTAALLSVQRWGFIRGVEERRIWEVHWGGREKELTERSQENCPMAFSSLQQLRNDRGCSWDALLFPSSACRTLSGRQAAGKPLSRQLFPTLQHLAFLVFIYFCIFQSITMFVAWCFYFCLISSNGQ